MLSTHSSLGVNQTASTIGGLAVGVPGEMRGACQIMILLYTC